MENVGTSTLLRPIRQWLHCALCNRAIVRLCDVQCIHGGSRWVPGDGDQSWWVAKSWKATGRFVHNPTTTVWWLSCGDECDNRVAWFQPRRISKGFFIPRTAVTVRLSSGPTSPNAPDGGSAERPPPETPVSTPPGSPVPTESSQDSDGFPPGTPEGSSDGGDADVSEGSSPSSPHVISSDSE